VCVCVCVCERVYVGARVRHETLTRPAREREQNKAHAPVVLRSQRFPGAVVVAHGPRFVCFYHGWGEQFDGRVTTPKLTTELVCPKVCADDVYRVSFRRGGGVAAHKLGYPLCCCIGWWGSTLKAEGRG